MIAGAVIPALSLAGIFLLGYPLAALIAISPNQMAALASANVDVWWDLFRAE